MIRVYTLLLWMVIGFGQASALPPMFIVNGETIWLLKDGQTNKVYSVRDMPQRTLDDLSDTELPYVDAILATLPDHDDLLTTRITGIRALSENRLIVEVENVICAHGAVGTRDCAGYWEFLLIDMQSGIQTLFQLDLHYVPAFDLWDCDSRRNAETIEFTVNHVVQQFYITVMQPSIACVRNMTYGFLIDYSNDEIFVQEFPFSFGFQAAPDEQHFAFRQLLFCDNATDLCLNEIKVYSTQTRLQTASTLQNPVSHVRIRFSNSWKDNEHIIFQELASLAWNGSQTRNQLTLWNTTSGESRSILVEGMFESIHSLSDDYLIGNSGGEIHIMHMQYPFETVTSYDGYGLWNVVEDAGAILRDADDTTYLLDTDLHLHAIPKDILPSDRVWFFAPIPE